MASNPQADRLCRQYPWMQRVACIRNASQPEKDVIERGALDEIRRISSTLINCGFTKFKQGDLCCIQKAACAMETAATVQTLVFRVSLLSSTSFNFFMAVMAVVFHEHASALAYTSLICTELGLPVDIAERVSTFLVPVDVAGFSLILSEARRAPKSENQRALSTCIIEFGLRFVPLARAFVR